jgi:hypothetical protein
MYTLGPRRRRAADRRLRAEAAAALGTADPRRRRGRGRGESERAHAVAYGRRHERVCRRGSERALGGAGRVLAARRAARSHTEHSFETKAVQPFLSFVLVSFVEFKLVVWAAASLARRLRERLGLHAAGADARGRAAEAVQHDPLLRRLQLG